MATDELEINANTIIAAKRRRVALRQDQVPINAIIALANMQKGSQSILTEVSATDDPVKVIGQIRHEDIYDPVASALRYIRHGTDALALFTDNKVYSKGMDDLTFISRGINVPIICQDYIINSYHVAEARAAGASAVVIYSDLLEYTQLRDVVSNTMRWRMTAIVQVNSEQQLADAALLSPHVIAVGSGQTFDKDTDLDTLRRLRPYMPYNTRVMPMGCLHDIETIEAVLDIGVDAIIVDERLLNHKLSSQRLHNLIYPDST